ncbi:MAG: hypothetical protein ABS944_11155 [Solibacillus sp.]
MVSFVTSSICNRFFNRICSSSGNSTRNSCIFCVNLKRSSSFNS